ncbi:MAG: U4/U6 small nuclear ribonucleoprotein prp4 [Bathelium mastoideum]|nr:MAG: U4/U6 small nuclear ribonucleoprotein prp4 [Bathelium mastoideum]
MSSSSESEGEIVEAKATTAQHHERHNTVNSHARTPSTPTTPIRTLDGSCDDDRSNSPYRDPAPRGEKRRHDDYHRSSYHDYYAPDEYASSRHGSYNRDGHDDYRQRSYRRDPYSRDEFGRDDHRRNSYQTSSQDSRRRDSYSDAQFHNRNYDDQRHNSTRYGVTRSREHLDPDVPGRAANYSRGDNIEEKRRSRSRSPKRQKAQNYRDRSDEPITKNTRAEYVQRLHEARLASQTRKRQGKENSVSDRGNIPTRPRLSESQAERPTRTSYQVSQAPAKVKENAQHLPFGMKEVLQTQANSNDVKKREAEAVAASVPAEEDADVDRKREERRKRIEEIKAKHAAEAAAVNQEPQVNPPLSADAPLSGDATPQAGSVKIPEGPWTPSAGSATSPEEQSSFAVEAPETALTGNTPNVDSTQALLGDNATESVPDGPVQNDEAPAKNPEITAAARRPDEPSAADDALIQDMAADQLRDMKRREEFATTQDRENAVADASQDSPIQGSVGESSPNSKSQKPVTDIDMFADDDDDMFALDADNGAAQGSTRVPQELNASMLDDWDTSEGYYKVWLGELLDKRYSVKEQVGGGVFSGVIRAEDQTMRKTVAIKIIRNNDLMRKAAATEISVLTHLRSMDERDFKHIVHLERSFEHKGHLCMVFENLSMDMRSFLKKVGHHGLSMATLRRHAHQMFLALDLLRDTQILHADLKPDNILVSEDRNTLKVCDLGSAINMSHAYAIEPQPYLASRFYRAPELILGLKYDYAVDMWSIGCTLFELYTGNILFLGQHNNGMLRTMMECRGPIPKKLLKRANEVRIATNGRVEFPFNEDFDQFFSCETDKRTGREIGKWIHITKLHSSSRDLKARIYAGVEEKKLPPKVRDELKAFYDLLDKCLQFYPERRITPKLALQHPFFTTYAPARRI